MPTSTIWLVASIVIALPAFAALTVLLVLLTPTPAWLGLLGLAIVDISIIVGGFVVVRRSLALVR
jgi:hypothetical protein